MSVLSYYGSTVSIRAFTYGQRSWRTWVRPDISSTFCRFELMSGRTNVLQGVPKKRGISECCSVCSTVQFMLNLEFLLLVHLKVEIHMCVPSTEPSLSDIRELKNVIFKYIIQHQLLIRSQMNSIIPILHRLTSA